MSNKTCNLSTDQFERTSPLPPRDLQLGLTNGSHVIDSSQSPSPDSSSFSNMSDREASGSPDVLDCCLVDASPVDTTYNSTFLQASGICSVSTNLNQTFIATPVNGSVNFWNENLSLMRNHENGSEKYQALSKTPYDGSNSVVMSPDSAGRESRLGSCEMSRTGSTENDCYSLSSGEMVIRSSSFCLEDQSLLVFSSMDESSICQAAAHPAFPASDSNLLSTTFPDVCEKSTERVIEDIAGHPGLGMTFNQTNEENDPLSPSIVALPSENEGALLMTFICETSPADSGKESQFAELLHLPGAFTPGQGKAFVDNLSPRQDNDKDIQTSTPVQTIGNKIPTLPSFSESPFPGNADSPALLPVKKPQIPATPKQRLVSGMPPSIGRVKKMEIKKFPKSDLSSVRSKIVTRNVHPMPTPGRATLRKQAQVHRGVTFQVSPDKVKTSLTSPSNIRMVSNAERKVNSEADNLGVTVMLSPEDTAVDGQGKSRESSPLHLPAANTLGSAFRCNNVCSETEHTDSSQVAGATAQHVGNETFCFSSLEKSPDRSVQTEPKPTPAKCVSTKIEVKAGSAASGQNKPLVRSTWLHSSSENSSLSRPLKEKKTPLKVSTSFTFTKPVAHQGPTKPGNLNCSSQNKQTGATNRPAEHSTRGAKKSSPLAESKKSSIAGALWDDIKSKFQRRPTSRQTKGAASLSQAPAACPRPATVSARQRQVTPQRDERRTSKSAGSPQSWQKSSAGSQRAQATVGPYLGTPSAQSNKPQVNGSRPLQTPSRTSAMGPTSATRLSRRNLAQSSVHTGLNEGAGNTQVSGGAAQKQTPFKTVPKARLITTPARNTAPALATACKPTTSTSRGASATPLKKTPVARLFSTSSAGLVDKSKPKASARQQPPQQQKSQPNKSYGPPDVVPARAAEGGRKDQSIKEHGGLLAASNQRFEAIAIVLQQALAERDESKQHCRDLSQELVNLRGELVSSVHSTELLEKEKDELRVALEDALQKVQQQHQTDLEELEQRLREFYQTEWDKVHLSYQEETDKCKTLMQQQMGELEANHKALKLELEKSHTEQLQCVKQQYDTSVEELRKVHNEEMQSVQKTLEESEAALSEQIEKLTAENKAFLEKLTAEENRRKEMAAKCQKDSHTLYLEQELESLKFVLDIKNKQLHQQEKKMMDIDKLKEKNVKLNESFQKVQQENEDFRARMDRHTALSRQLSTDQAALQETLQKESKVNKRLSMENEELLWKLHNGDLSSPRKLSPTTMSPSHSFNLQSPRSSALFSSPPVSPR